MTEKESYKKKEIQSQMKQRDIKVEKAKMAKDEELLIKREMESLK